jgi:hypothetical protein
MANEINHLHPPPHIPQLPRTTHGHEKLQSLLEQRRDLGKSRRRHMHAGGDYRETMFFLNSPILASRLTDWIEIPALVEIRPNFPLEQLQVVIFPSNTLTVPCAEPENMFYFNRLG